jgi:hydroxymethylpyrimidine kinase/phosphomethylpyrimidine kinase
MPEHIRQRYQVTRIGVNQQRATEVVLRPRACQSSGSAHVDKKRYGWLAMFSVPCALTISGLDPSGGAGVFADMRAFASASVWGCGVVAVSTIQSTSGLRSSHPVGAPLLLRQIRELWSRQNIRSIKIGALGSLENTRAVARWLATISDRVPVVIDPVLRASRGQRSARLLDERATSLLLGMAKLAAVITPNVPEAEALLGERIRSVRDAERAANRLVAAGARAALVKGGHLPTRSSPEGTTDVLAVRGSVFHLRARRVKTKLHGTGCTLASLIAGKLALAQHVDDDAIVAAVRWAKKELGRALARPVSIGPGLLVLPL